MPLTKSVDSTTVNVYTYDHDSYLTAFDTSVAGAGEYLMTDDAANKPTSGRSWIVVSACVIVLLAFLAYDATNLLVTKEGYTGARMRGVSRRVAAYWVAHNRLPENLSQLPTDVIHGGEIIDNDIVDGWGREMIYRPRDDGEFTLKSYGRDGRPGGTGKNADIRMVFIGPSSSLTVFDKRRHLGAVHIEERDERSSHVTPSLKLHNDEARKDAQ